jgi:phosphoglycerate dehydrogenase-like enzyme
MEPDPVRPIQACGDAGSSLCNAYGHGPALGEFAIMTLAWRYRLVVREGSSSWSSMVGGEIGGESVGVTGLRHIDREVYLRAAALGCRVLAVNRTVREKPAFCRASLVPADILRSCEHAQLQARDTRWISQR